MKTRIHKGLYFILFFLYFLSGNLKGQVHSYTEVVALTAEAVSSRSAEKLEPFLAEDFSISGHSGDMARRVLNAVLQQLNDEVTSYDPVSKIDEKNGHTITYTFHYREKGPRETVFVFDPEGKLRELHLFKLMIQKVAETRINESFESIIVVPFDTTGGLIVVWAQLDGTSRPFLLDSGAPRLILNSRYASQRAEGAVASQSRGASGEIATVGTATIERFDWHGIRVESQTIMTIDLAHLEESTGQEIYGLIGYDLLKGYDLLLDYEASRLVLLRPEETLRWIGTEFPDRKWDQITFQYRSHLAVIPVQIGPHIYRMALDTGAEANLLSDSCRQTLAGRYTDLEMTELQGADTITQSVTLSSLHALSIGCRDFLDTRLIWGSLDHLNTPSLNPIDGIIGYPVLSLQPTLIRHQEQEIWLAAQHTIN